MPIQDFFQSITDRLQSSASVKTVFGDPVSAEGKTVIPVARIAYGFGGGSGTCKREGEQTEPCEGGGGGGGIMAAPTGVVEITQEQTRFIPINDNRRFAGVLTAGFLLGLLIGKRRCRS